jgi:hypothetical protein
MHVSLHDCYDLYDSLEIVPCKLKHGEVCFNREHYGDSWYNVHFFLVYLLHVKL